MRQTFNKIGEYTEFGNFTRDMIKEQAPVQWDVCNDRYYSVKMLLATAFLVSSARSVKYY